MCNVAHNIQFTSSSVSCIALLADKKGVLLQCVSTIAICTHYKKVFLAELFCKMNKLMKKNSQFPIIPAKPFSVHNYFWGFYHVLQGLNDAVYKSKIM